jgi:DNA-binding MarR family transcriptional regulator
VERDFVDWVIERWTEERPDLDLSSVEIVGRLLRISGLLEQRFERLCDEYGFGFWAFTVLTALRRSGSPYELTPRQLQSAGMVSAAAVTKRITRLEELGLVERTPDPMDRRGTLVGLTERGLDVIDGLVGRHLEEERSVVDGLSGKDRATLARLLREVLLRLEGPRTGPTRRR